MLCYAAIFLHAYYQFNKNSDKTRNWCSMFFSLGSIPLSLRYLAKYSCASKTQTLSLSASRYQLKHAACPYTNNLII